MENIDQQRSTRTIALGGLVLAILLLAALPAQAGGGSQCTSASVPEAFVMPDGSEYPAGNLKLCVERRHSPIAHMHKTYVNGMPIGLHIGRTGTSEGPATAGSYVMFGRGTDGRLRLLGYARPGTKHMQVFSLRHATHIIADPLQADRVQEGTLVIAALTR